MRIFSYVLLLLIISFTLEAQQVKKIDCCQDVTPKATIIINESTSNGTTSSTTTTSTNPTNGVFNFELKSSLNTSAGVYNSSGVLIRTLWSGARYDVGCYSAAWDGYLDDGVTVAPVGNYTIKLLTNNVQYTWEGGIGDSSTDPLTNTKLVGNNYSTMVAVGDKAFFSIGYSEHGTAERVVALSDINKIIPFTGANTTTMNMLSSCTDGNIIYFAGDKSGDGTNPYQTWVVGTYPADLSDPFKFIQFPARVTASYRGGSGNFDDQNAIAYSNNSNSYISSISVQKTGNYLFLTRPGLNQLQVIDKRITSGVVLQTLSITGINEVAVDANSYLYALVAGQLKKYIVNNDATLTNTATRFTGISNGSKITYSAYLDKLAVFDNATSQIKIYNPIGGAPVKVVGIANGYASSPYFSAGNIADANLLYYQDDGTLWVGQPGIYSLIHYNLDFTIKESSQHRGSTHCVSVDQNNPDHIFGSYTEYVRDYSKPLDNGSNGSWKVYANWIGGRDVGNLNYDGLRWVGTLSNGHRYGIVRSTGVSEKLYELTPTGLRLILDYVGDGVNIGRDGTWYEYGDNGQGRGIYRKLLTGFDSNNNPVWSASTLWVANPPNSSFYTPWYGYQNKTSGLTASADKYVYFNNGTTAEQGLDKSGNTVGYRLGAVKASSGLPIWKTSRTTSYNYSGPYPVNGDFDIGNNTGYQPQHSETYAMAYDDDIFWNVNGEFWQNGEANHWNHFDGKTGLFIGHFGTDGNLASLIPGAPGFSGNSISTTMAKANNGNYYMYNDDESGHAFIHSWKVSGLNTIQITTVPITLSGAVTLPTDATNLMTGVPFRSNSFFGGSGWTMNPSAGINNAPDNPYPTWRITTTKNSYLKSDNDIYIESDGNANGTYRTVSRALGSNNTNNWTLSFGYKINSNLNGNYNLDLLDATGKILITFGTQYSFHLINGNRYQENALNANTSKYRFANFSAKNVNGQVSVSIDGYPYMNVVSNDPGGNFNTPATFRVRAGGSGDQHHTLLSVKGLRFVPN